MNFCTLLIICAIVISSVNANNDGMANDKAEVNLDNEQHGNGVTPSGASRVKRGTHTCAKAGVVDGRTYAVARTCSDSVCDDSCAIGGQCENCEGETCEDCGCVCND